MTARSDGAALIHGSILIDMRALTYHRCSELSITPYLCIIEHYRPLHAASALDADTAADNTVRFYCRSILDTCSASNIAWRYQHCMLGYFSIGFNKDTRLFPCDSRKAELTVKHVVLRTAIFGYIAYIAPVAISNISIELHSLCEHSRKQLF